MSALGSELFRIITQASAQRVWETLTATGGGVDYLYGLIIEATWRPGSTVTAAGPAGPQLAGEILRADEPRLLSYTFGDKVGDPSVYVTWEVDAGPDATIVRLYVDEVHPLSSADIERAWLPVLAALEQRLRSGDDPHLEDEAPDANGGGGNGRGIERPGPGPGAAPGRPRTDPRRDSPA